MYYKESIFHLFFLNWNSSSFSLITQAITGDSVLLKFEKAKCSLADSLGRVEDIVQESIGCQVFGYYILFWNVFEFDNLVTIFTILFLSVKEMVLCCLYNIYKTQMLAMPFNSYLELPWPLICHEWTLFSYSISC